MRVIAVGTIGVGRWSLALSMLCVACLAAHAPAAAQGADFEAPDPGGSESPNVELPPPGGKLFGINEDYIDFAHHQSPEAYADHAYRVGANAVKLSLDWWRAERFQRDEWVDRRWQVWERAYNAFRARGITPVLVLSAAPCWARTVPCAPGDAIEPGRFPPSPAFDAEWGEFVEEVARRFPRSIIQVWNEPNLRTWWRDGPNPTRYVDVLREAWLAVQRVEAELGLEITVSGPGVTNALTASDTPAYNMTMGRFLDEAYAAGMEQWNDATSIHVFAHPAASDWQHEFGADSRFAETFQRVRAYRTAAGETDPIYVTESGIAAQYPGSPAFPYTEQMRMDALRRLYNRVMTMDDPAHPVKLLILHRMIEPRDASPFGFEVEIGYGWLRYDPAPPAQDPQTQAAGLPEPKWVYCLFSHGAFTSTGDAERFYPRCGAELTSPGARNTDGSWTFRFGTPHFPFWVRLQCRIDAEPFAPCDSATSHTTAPLAPGTHEFFVRPVDLNGTPMPATRTTFPDRIAPITGIDSGPEEGAMTGDTRPTFEFSASEPAEFECEIDGAAPVPCTSPWRSKETDALRDGPHTFSVRGVDAAGNTGARVLRAFTVETGPPTVAVTSGPANGASTGDPTPTFAFTADEPSTFRCRVDAEDPMACDSGTFTAPSLADGHHDFRVIATDGVGRESAPVRHGFTVDTSAPTVTITSGPAQDAVTSDVTPSFTFTADEPGTAFECLLDAPPWGVCSAQDGSHTTPALADATNHCFAVRAVDRAGNVSAAASRCFRVSLPNARITRVEVRSRRRKATVKFEGSGGQGELKFRCRLDSKPKKPCGSPKTYKRLRAGRHVAKVWAIDAHGVVGPVPAKQSFRIRR